MPINPVIEAVQAAFRLEITNRFTTTDNTLTVTVPDHQPIVIRALPVAPDHVATPAPQPTTIPDAHTFHYIHQHNPTTRLLLHNLEECRAYLDDVCHTFLNAEIRDNEITFPDGTTYCLLIDGSVKSEK